MIEKKWSSPMSSEVAFWAQTQNLITKYSLTFAGTIWSFPEALMVVKSFWFSWLEPKSRKQTSPTWHRKQIFVVSKFFWLVLNTVRSKSLKMIMKSLSRHNFTVHNNSQKIFDGLRWTYSWISYHHYFCDWNHFDNIVEWILDIL